MSVQETCEQPRKQYEGLGNLAFTVMKAIIMPPVQESAWVPLNNIYNSKDPEKQYLKNYLHTQVILKSATMCYT